MGGEKIAVGSVLNREGYENSSNYSGRDASPRRPGVIRCAAGHGALSLPE